MDSIQLKYFCVVCEMRSYAKAAEKLYISPQGVNKAIHKLESELEVPLLEITPDGLVPTQYGKVLLRHARQYLTEHQQTLNELKVLRENADTALTIGIKAGFSNGLGPDFLVNFLLHHPELKISIRSYSHDLLNDAMQDPGTPVWILPGPYDRNLFRPVYHRESRMFLLASEDHPLSKLEKVTLRDIANYPRVSLAHDIGQKSAVDIAMSPYSSDSPEFLLQAADRDLTMRLIQTGRAISFHSGWYYQRYPGIRRIEIEDLNVTLQANVLLRNDAFINKALAAFIDYVHGIFPE